MPPLARLISLGVLTTLIVLLGITFYKVLAPFLLPLFLAWVAAILCRPLYLWVCDRTRGRSRLAAGVTTTGLLLIVLLPLVLGTVLAAAQLIGLATNLLNREDELRQRLTQLTSDPRVVQIARWLEPYLVEIPDETSDGEAVDPAYLFAPGRDPFLDQPSQALPAPDDDITLAPSSGDSPRSTIEPGRDDEAETPPGVGTAEPEATSESDANNEGESTDSVSPAPPTSDSADDPTEAVERPEPDSGTDDEVEELSPEEIRIAEEAARQRLEARLQASLRSTLKYVGGRTIGLLSEVPGVALGVLGQAVSLLVAIVMFSIGLYYFLCDGPDLVKAAEALIPVQQDYQRELMRRFDQVVRAVVLSTFLSALAQGILTTFALWAVGFGHLFVFFVLASLAAMIPLAGTWVVWGPCAAWLALYEDEYFKAAGLVIFGLVVVGTIDNLIRTYILNTNAKLHPLLAFVSVLGGLQVMGLWGVFIAPIVAACLHALIQIFNAELQTFSQERAAVRDGDGDPPPAQPVLATVTPPAATPPPPSAEKKQPSPAGKRH